MFEYSGWNPYQTQEMASATVSDFMNHYNEPQFYSWAIDHDNTLIGTIGAYDYEPDKNRIEVGLSIERDSWGQGFAAEALSAVLHFLTEKEGIRTVIAWCASENVGSQIAMQNAGMHMVCMETGALEIHGETYDKLTFEYKMQP